MATLTLFSRLGMGSWLACASLNPASVQAPQKRAGGLTARGAPGSTLFSLPAMVPAPAPHLSLSGLLLGVSLWPPLSLRVKIISPGGPRSPGQASLPCVPLPLVATCTTVSFVGIPASQAPTAGPRHLFSLLPTRPVLLLLFPSQTSGWHHLSGDSRAHFFISAKAWAGVLGLRQNTHSQASL